MLFNLEEIQPGKPIDQEMHLEGEVMKTVSGEAVLDQITARIRFQTDPLGYVIHYDVNATTHMPCIRCAEDLDVKVDLSDWISLRVKQPGEGHLVLDDAEMNVRFITSPRFDIKAFILEVIELELPGYPRHEDGETRCIIPVEGSEAEVEEKKPSPFDALSKLLEKDKG